MKYQSLSDFLDPEITARPSKAAGADAGGDCREKVTIQNCKSGSWLASDNGGSVDINA
jgi:hypothetical protein